MNSIQLVLLVIEVALIYLVQSKQLCDFANTECTTLAAENIFKTVVSGIPGLIEPSDPIYLKEVNYEDQTLNYQITNASMTGLTNCQVKQMTMNAEELTYQNYLQCPQLVFNHPYVAKGFLGPVEIDGKGVTTIILNDYTMIFKGNYGTYISENDQKLHFFLKNYKLEFEPKSKPLINIQGELHSNEAKSELAKAYIYEHSADVEKLLRSPTLERYMKIYMDRANIFIKATPAEELLSV